LIRLLQAYVEKGAAQIVAASKLEALLGIYQKMIASKNNDHEGFYLLESIIENVELPHLTPYLTSIFSLLFKRLSSSKTVKFVKGFLVFSFLYILKHGPNSYCQIVDGLQTSMMSLVIERIVIPELQKVSGVTERRICAGGLVRLLTECDQLIGGTYASQWIPLLTAFIGLIELPEDTSVPDDEHFIEIEETPGYQAVYSQLAFAGKKQKDPLEGTTADPRHNLAQALQKLSQTKPGHFPVMIEKQMNENARQYLYQYLNAAGVQLS